ncbi:hypothetical protein AKO1_002802 [Acrasis kona]|uniref:Uncharacterized protein n=1 Tax=Acrasis kona TaxID=1008807 RepID=A0AAW2Z0I7_9EUKA
MPSLLPTGVYCPGDNYGYRCPDYLCAKLFINLTMRTPSLDKSLCMILDVPSDIKELQQKEAPILPKSIKIDVKSTTLLLPWRHFANNHLQHCSEYNST